MLDLVEERSIEVFDELKEYGRVLVCGRIVHFEEALISDDINDVIRACFVSNAHDAFFDYINEKLNDLAIELAKEEIE